MRKAILLADVSKRQDNFIATCKRCQTSYSCCHETLPPITERRKNIIENYLRRHRIRIASPFQEREYTHPGVDEDGYCVFHDRKTHLCRIHNVKPETCVSGPITFDINQRTGEIEWFIKIRKICPLAGVIYADEHLLREHLDAAKGEIGRLVRELDPKALKAILRKAEPETFRIPERFLFKP